MRTKYTVYLDAESIDDINTHVALLNAGGHYEPRYTAADFIRTAITRELGRPAAVYDRIDVEPAPA